MAGGGGSDDLTEEERRALRGSKFAPLPAPPPSNFHPRLAHPGGPVKTNKAAALAKFLERKLQEPEGLKSIDPDLLEAAVIDAKKTVNASSGTSTSRRKVLHVDSFEDSIESSSEDEVKKKKRTTKKKKVSKDNEEEGKDSENKREKKKKKKKKKKEKKMKFENGGKNKKLKA